MFVKKKIEGIFYRKKIKIIKLKTKINILIEKILKIKN